MLTRVAVASTGGRVACAAGRFLEGVPVKVVGLAPLPCLTFSLALEQPVIPATS